MREDRLGGHARVTDHGDARPVEPGAARGEFEDAPSGVVGVEVEVAEADDGEQRLEGAVAAAQLVEHAGAGLRFALQVEADAAQFELVDGEGGEFAQHVRLVVAEVEGRVVHDAERAHGVPVRGDERRARVEARAPLAPREGVLAEAGVRAEVRDDEDVAERDGVRAHGARAGSRERGASVAGLAEEAVLRDEVHGGDSGAEDAGGEAGDAVEGFLGEGVENAVAGEGVQPEQVVRRVQGRRGHRWVQASARRRVSDVGFSTSGHE